MDKLISVIVPVYNVENYLAKCLESLIGQTYKNIEIICINDGSKDGSLNLLYDFQKKDSRIKVINQENAGVSAARNKGIENSGGEYLLFVDADDWLREDACEKLMEAAKTFPDMVLFNYIGVSEKINRYVNRTQPDSKKNMIIKGDFKCRLYKKQFVTENNISFPVGMNYSEDFTFTCYFACLDPTVVAIPDYLYYYLVDREGSAIHNWKNRIHEDFRSFSFFINTPLYNSLSDDDKLFVIDNWGKVFYKCWSNLEDLQYLKDYNKVLDSFMQYYKEFDYQKYKNLTGYKWIKHRYFVRLLKLIRDIYFKIRYRK